MEDAKDETFQDEVFGPYALAIGQATLAWNDMHSWLGVLLQSILYPRQSNLMHLLWRSMTQDRAARQMLRAAASGHYQNSAEAADAIIWLVGQIDRLEDTRNDIIHTQLIRDSENHVVVNCEGGARAGKLAAKPDLLAEIHWCRDAALVLRNYALDLDRAIESVHVTLPEKPSLPNRGQKTKPPSPPLQPQSK